MKEFDAAVNAPRRGRAAAPRHSLAEPGGAADAKSEDEDEEEEDPAPRRVCFSFKPVDPRSCLNPFNRLRSSHLSIFSGTKAAMKNNFGLCITGLAARSFRLYCFSYFYGLLYTSSHNIGILDTIGQKLQVIS